MSKRLTALFASLMLACGLSLAACGSPANNTEQPKEEAKQETTQEKTDEKKDEKKTEEPAAEADPQEKFVGEWKLAKAEMGGLTFAGDFTTMLGSEKGATLTIAKDGTGTMSLAETDSKLTWKLADNDSITVTILYEDSENTPPDVKVVYDKTNQALVMTMTAESEQSVLTFTADGALKDLPSIDVSKATNITSIDQIAGTWKMIGAGMGGTYIYGEGEALNEMMSNSLSPTLTIAADGSVDLFDVENAKVTVDENGATIAEAGSLMSFKLLDGNLVMDMSTLLGENAYVLYQK